MEKLDVINGEYKLKDVNVGKYLNRWEDIK